LRALEGLRASHNRLSGAIPPALLLLPTANALSSAASTSCAARISRVRPVVRAAAQEGTWAA